MSEWLLDLGNSRLKCAPLTADGQPGEVRALGHEAQHFVAGLDQVLPARGSCAYVASVASPTLTVEVLDALTARFDRISIARTPAAMGGLRVAYAQPNKLGVDRFLALLAAQARGRGDWLVAGVGTALTIDLLDAQGQHHGGRIAPSPTLMRRSMHEAAAQLPAQGGNYVEFASDTEDALASGALGAAIGLIERSLRQAGQVLGRTPNLLLHGGGAEALRAYFGTAQWEPSLVLLGLAAWAEHARGATPTQSER